MVKTKAHKEIKVEEEAEVAHNKTKWAEEVLKTKIKGTKTITTIKEIGNTQTIIKINRMHLTNDRLIHLKAEEFYPWAACPHRKL